MTIPTGINLLRVATSRASIIETRVATLERQRTTSLEGNPSSETHHQAISTEDEGPDQH